jgi:hypothetical protein
MTVDVDFGKGTATQRLNEEDPDGIFAAQNQQVNAYLADKIATLYSGDKFKPFEGANAPNKVDSKQLFKNL